MRRPAIILFLFVLFQAFFAGNGHLPRQQAAVYAAGVELPLTPGFSSESQPRSEMEHGAAYDYTVLKTNQAPDQSAGYLANQPRRSAAGTELLAGRATPSPERFDNGNLLYNYPSHNFW